MQPAVTGGLNGSQESLAAARWAADEAEKHKLTLYVPHAWPLPAPEPTHVPSDVDQNAWAKRPVRTAQAELQARHPGLSIAENLVTDDAHNALPRAATGSDPAKAVVRAAEGAALLVVGRRVHGPGPAPQPGPGRATVHHGRCPVAVVRHD